MAHKQQPGKDFYTGRVTNCPSFPWTEGFSARWDFQSQANRYDWLAFIQVMKLNHTIVKAAAVKVQSLE